MALTLLQMYGAGSGGTENALASIDVPEDGQIVGVQWALEADMDADLEFIRCEVSFIATNTINTNDARGMISAIRGMLNLTTTGGSFAAINVYVPIPDLDVSGGERLYLHMASSASMTSAVNAMCKYSRSLLFVGC